METYIDCHGPDHGLSVAFDGSDVRIADYSEMCEANAETGRWEGVYRETTVPIAELLNPKGEHRTVYHSYQRAPDGSMLKGRAKMRDVIIEASIGWLAYWGVSTDEMTIIDVETDDRACGFFAEDWGDHDGPLILRCGACAEKRRKDLADAVREYAYPEAYYREHGAANFPCPKCGHWHNMLLPCLTD